jgi:hypothetical protein
MRSLVVLEGDLAWCDKVDLWDDGMAPTLDHDEPGIGAGVIDATAKEAQREAEERAARAGSVRVSDRAIDPEHADWTEILAKTAARLSKAGQTGKADHAHGTGRARDTNPKSAA